MKIAVPVKDNNQIDAHFGHCAFYQIYEISSNQVVSVTKMDSSSDDSAATLTSCCVHSNETNMKASATTKPINNQEPR